MGIGGHQPTYLYQTPNTNRLIAGVSLRGITFVVQRETTQTAS